MQTKRPERELKLAASQGFDVFISHRSTETSKAIATNLYFKLQKRNINCFLDTKNIGGGESFLHTILSNVRRSRLVIVIFDDNLSSWVLFEASCAFFDQKLLPVAINEAEVPPPYNRIHNEKINTNDSINNVEAGLNRIADQAEEMLDGEGHTVFTRLCRRFNSLFYTGIQIISLLVFGFILFKIDPGNLHDHVLHAHVSLGAVVLGGQFFLSLAFARTVASSSFREREYGFETTEKLFHLWGVFAIIQLCLGIYLASTLDDGRLNFLKDWIYPALIFYF